VIIYAFSNEFNRQIVSFNYFKNYYAFHCLCKGPRCLPIAAISINSGMGKGTIEKSSEMTYLNEMKVKAIIKQLNYDYDSEK
jgi:hypothetical protein